MEQGDRAGFEAMVRARHDALLAYALVRAEAEIARDATADTFAIAWGRLDEVPAQPRAWLIAITCRTLADQYRAPAAVRH
jgi:RNA polymerase sigma-70 factor (ECF subfamily)